VPTTRHLPRDNPNCLLKVLATIGRPRKASRKRTYSAFQSPPAKASTEFDTHIPFNDDDSKNSTPLTTPEPSDAEDNTGAEADSDPFDGPSRRTRGSRRDTQS
jgi:hypothetical protein